MKVIGKHIIINLYEPSNEKVYHDTEYVKDLLRKMAELSNMIIVDIYVKKFNPAGISGIALVVESHITIHSWYREKYVTIDIYTCGDKSNPWKAYEFVINELKPKEHKLFYVDRSQ